MELSTIMLVVAATFGICWLFDAGFTKIFRGKTQHRTGLSVRLSKKYGLFGIILAVLGVAAMAHGSRGETALLVGGIVVLLVGIGLMVYYLTFGVYYDADSFILTTFGKKSVTYRHCDIRTQQLYLSGGQTVIELQLKDGRTVLLQSGMEGVYPFLDAAFEGWCRQKGKRKEDCPFHDPDNSCWFPAAEVE